MSRSLLIRYLSISLDTLTFIPVVLSVFNCDSININKILILKYIERLYVNDILNNQFYAYITHKKKNSLISPARNKVITQLVRGEF